MQDSADEAPPLVAAPRHLRRRAFHEEIPDTLLVPGVQPVALLQNPAPKHERHVKPPTTSAAAYHRRKRMVALVAMVFASISIPALIAALIVAG